MTHYSSEPKLWFVFTCYTIAAENVTSFWHCKWNMAIVCFLQCRLTHFVVFLLGTLMWAELTGESEEKKLKSDAGEGLVVVTCHQSGNRHTLSGSVDLFSICNMLIAVQNKLLKFVCLFIKTYRELQVFSGLCSLLSQQHPHLVSPQITFSPMQLVRAEEQFLMN